MLNAASVFMPIASKDLAKEKHKDSILWIVYQCITAVEKFKSSTISIIKPNAVRKYLLQFKRITSKQGVLH